MSAGRFAGGAIAMGDGTQLGRGVIVARNRCSRKVVVVLTLDKIFFLKDTKFTALPEVATPAPIWRPSPIKP